MLTLVLRRIVWMVPTLFVVSLISFLIIQLPPGDYLTSYIAALGETGETVDEAQAAALRARYALDEPVTVQYIKWFGGLFRGEFGMSFEWNRPVRELIGERILLTTIISIVTLLFTWALAIPIGIYSAVKQYSLPDYMFTFVGFIGLATPNFLLALICMYVGYSVFGVSAGGLFSPAFQNASWSLARFVDLMSHLWIPVIVIGTSGTAGMIRVMRANLLDELRKQYVMTARAKGLAYWRLLLKYPVRVALNPLVSTVGWVLPAIVSGSTITSVVLGLPTTGPLLLRALLNQDMYLAGSMVMMLSFLTLIGTLLSDLLLLWLDPRIRYDQAGSTR
ncbi:ABC transporter permease [Candidatus Poribacteria bacterium]|nr:ABC transporter permease [Candidatus Poribacteria bacterium]MBT5536616.1 ABC transporter permease [Candidatus Poribacteria bacterium]MBT5712422.1 ABC transporter permease [Candidatus Poribacteria bacterium]MBT7804400.1 ABC transporter permease [Candidatus Poribacteria bacterium]